MNARNRDSYQHLFKNLNILPLKSQYIFSLVLFVILHEIRKWKANWIGHILRRNCLLQRVIERKITRGDRSDRKTRKKM